MANVAQSAVEDAKMRAKEGGVDVPYFIKANRKGKGEASKWFEGTKLGMVFKNGSQG